MGWPSKSSKDANSSEPSQTREDQADKDLQAFLRELEADTRTTNYPSTHFPSQTNTSTTPSTIHDEPSNNRPISESLLPTTMSCREAFDSAFYCQSVGGQFMNVYRYGELRDCREKWGDFWFCMRTKSYKGADKGNIIREHYRGKERRKYGIAGAGEGKSSEDVWRSRERKAEWGEVFGKDEPPVEPGMERLAR